MTMRAKASTVKESLTKKEKADIKKIAEKVKNDHKGAEKPQLLTKIKPDDKVTLCTFPVVTWMINRKNKDDESGDNGICCFTVSREVGMVNIQVTAATAKRINDACKNDQALITSAMRKRYAKDIYEQYGFRVDDFSAIEDAERAVMQKIEKIGLKFDYDKNAYSLGKIRGMIGEMCHILRTVRKFSEVLKHYCDAVDETIYVLPDMDKFTVKDRKFVPVEKPAVPKKPTSKK